MRLIDMRRNTESGKTSLRGGLKDDPVPPINSGVSNVAETNPSTRVEGDNSQGSYASLLFLTSFDARFLDFVFPFLLQVHQKTIHVSSLPLNLIMVGTTGSTESTTWDFDTLTKDVAVFRCGFVKGCRTDRAAHLFTLFQYVTTAEMGWGLTRRLNGSVECCPRVHAIQTSEGRYLTHFLSM